MSCFERMQKLCCAASSLISNLNSGAVGAGHGISKTLRIACVMLAGHSVRPGVVKQKRLKGESGMKILSARESLFSVWEVLSAGESLFSLWRY